MALLGWGSTARAQLPLPASSQFSIVGSLQKATLSNPADSLSGGTVVVNGQLIVVPTNTIVEMPAAALTWQQVFALAPAPYGIPGTPGVTATVPETGWSLSDINGTRRPSTPTSLAWSATGWATNTLPPSSTSPSPA